MFSVDGVTVLRPMTYDCEKKGAVSARGFPKCHSAHRLGFHVSMSSQLSPFPLCLLCSDSLCKVGFLLFFLGLEVQYATPALRETITCLSSPVPMPCLLGPAFVAPAIMYLLLVPII
jgi:hypothetical protein